MPRPPRQIIAGVPHHIVHKGNNGTPIFKDDLDRHSYLSLLKDRCDRYDLEIHGWCLMLNHVHLVATPGNAESIQNAVGQAHNLHSRRFNKKYDRTGHLWQSCYYACALDESHFIRSLIYVDKNPVEAGLVENPWQYPWSSAGIHYGNRDGTGTDLVNTDSWLKISEEYGFLDLVWSDMDDFAEVLRRHTASGKPLGDKEFFKRAAQIVPGTLVPGTLVAGTLVAGTERETERSTC
jgi:putative transposase